MQRFHTILGATMIVLAAGAAMPADAENVIRFTSDGEVHTFDPHSVVHLETFSAQRQVYETLFNTSPKLELEPGLATSWRVVDHLTWEFELRHGVRFHDGTPFTAADVVFSLDRARGEDSEWNFLLDSVARVEAIDPRNVRIITNKPNALLPMQLRVIGIMSRDWATQRGVLTAERSDAAQET